MAVTTYGGSPYTMTSDPARPSDAGLGTRYTTEDANTARQKEYENAPGMTQEQATEAWRQWADYQRQYNNEPYPLGYDEWVKEFGIVVKKPPKAQSPTEANAPRIAAMQEDVDRNLDRYYEGIGQAGKELQQQHEQDTDEYEDKSQLLNSEAQARVFGRFAPVFDEINRLETDPAKVYDRMLAAELARLSVTPGGAAGQMAAQFQAANNPSLYAQAEEAVTEQQQRKTDIMLQATESLNDDDLALVGQAQDSLNRVLASDTEIAGIVAKLNAEEQMRFGALMVDLQKIISSERINFEKMSSDERIATMQDITQRYGIDKQFEANMAKIAAAGKITWKDAFNGVLGLGGAYVSTLGPKKG